MSNSQSKFYSNDLFSFIDSVITRDETRHDMVLVANNSQFKQVYKMLNEYYNFNEPQSKKHKGFAKSLKKMSLSEIEKISSLNNILKFDLDSKLSKHLNKLLLNRKDDEFLQGKYMAYMKNHPEAQSNVF